MPKFVVELDLTIDEIHTLRKISIERVLNDAISIGSYIETERTLPSKLREDGSTLWQDCEILKPIARHIWCTAQNAAFGVLKVDNV